MENNLYNAVDNILIPHSSFQLATKKILQCMKTAEVSPEPSCLAILGESRAGKSRILAHIHSKYPNQRMDDGMRIPIIRVTVPSPATIGGLAEAILRGLGDPKPEKGKISNQRERIMKLTRAAKTLMLMVDEFQHFYNEETGTVKHDVADWFKVLIDDCKISLVVSGLKTSQSIFNWKNQLAGRFMASIILPRFDWKNEELRDEFVSILEAFKTGLTQFDLPEINSDEMAFRFYCATGGLIGYVAKVLRQAVHNAVDEERQQITLEDLAVAYREAIYMDEKDLNMPNPFERGFVVQANEDLLQRVRLIGTSKPEELKPRKSRNKKLVRLTTGDVLHA